MTTETITTTTGIVAPPVTVVSPDYLANSDKRKTWALLILAGGGFVMTAYASAVLYLIQDVARYTYYLGLFAMLNIFIIFTGLVGMFVKRTVNVSKEGILVSDQINGSENQQS